VDDEKREGSTFGIVSSSAAVNRRSPAVRFAIHFAILEDQEVMTMASWFK